MRIAPLMMIAMLALGLDPAAAAPSRCEAGPKLFQPMAHAAAAAAACSAPGAAGHAPIRQAQWAPGSCGVPGQMTCVNGWIAVCQCYSYGCHFMATGRRC
jgi:hypothetical protein